VEERFGRNLYVNFHAKIPALLPFRVATTLAAARDARDLARDWTNPGRLRAQLDKLPQLISGEKQAEPNANQRKYRGRIRNPIDEQTAQNAYQD